MPAEAEQIRVGDRDHVVQFYERDDELLSSAGSYLVGAIRAGEVAVAIATPARLQAFDEALVAAGIDVSAARETGAFLTLDAAGTLSRFLIGGRPDADRFDSVVGSVIRGASGSKRPVRAYGEMVALLWAAGQVNAAIELETLWNDLAATIPFTLFCCYRMDPEAGSHQLDGLRAVRHLHTAVLATEPTPAGDPETEGCEQIWEFDANADAPRTARRLVTEAVDRWGHRELVEDAALLATELTTNAVRHACTRFTVCLSYRHGSVGISVRDWSKVLPTRHDFGPMAASGRGLRLLTALATRWGVEAVADGKVVWAQLGRSMTPGPGSPG